MTAPSRWHLWLLPGALREGADGRRSARDWAVDGVMVLVAAGVGIAILIDTWAAHRRGMVAVDVAFGLVALAALRWRRSHPDAVGVITAAAAVASALAAGPGLIGAFTVALRGSRRGILVVAALSGAGLLGFPLIFPPRDGYLLNVVIGALLMAVVFGWGLLARVRREQLLALRDRAVHAQADQRRRVELARDAERREIAREMHDVLAHRLSLLALHAGALEFRPDAPAQDVARAAGVIRGSAHAALQELRQVIGVLRDGPADGPPEPPQPTLDELPALVEESRAAGMRVALELDVGDAANVPATVGRTAYRVVQEGLTNARKHAPAAAVRVGVTRADDGLAVEIVNRLPAQVTAPVGPAGKPLPGAGSGLAGIAERVALAGGELEHGAIPAGYRVRARLPWAP